jgi:hypothetical protein
MSVNAFQLVSVLQNTGPGKPQLQLDVVGRAGLDSTTVKAHRAPPKATSNCGSPPLGLRGATRASKAAATAFCRRACARTAAHAAGSPLSTGPARVRRPRTSRADTRSAPRRLRTTTCRLQSSDIGTAASGRPGRGGCRGRSCQARSSPVPEPSSSGRRRTRESPHSLPPQVVRVHAWRRPYLLPHATRPATAWQGRRKRLPGPAGAFAAGPLLAERRPGPEAQPIVWSPGRARPSARLGWRLSTTGTFP